MHRLWLPVATILIIGISLSCGGSSNSISGTPPTFTTQPQPQAVAAGQEVTFSVTASGDPTPSYQWERSTDSGVTWNSIDGASNPSYTLTAQPHQDAWYRAKASNRVGTTTSSPAPLIVYFPPTFTINPLDQAVIDEQLVTFTVGLAAIPPPAIQWERSNDGGATWSMVDGASSTSYSFIAHVGDHGARFRVLAVNYLGRVWSGIASLIIQTPPNTAPSITLQPALRIVPEGQSTTLFAAAIGDPTPSFQWERSNDGGVTWNPIVGATTSSYTLTVQLAYQNLKIRVKAMNSIGAVTGIPVLFVVGSKPEPVSAASFSTFVIKADRTLWATGRNQAGELGTGDRTDQHQLVQVLDDVSAVAAGDNHTLALRSNGDLWGTGMNILGELGWSPPIDPLRFGHVLDGVSAVAAKGDHTLVLKVDGTLWGAGQNYNGWLGTGSTADQNSFVQVLTDVKLVATSWFDTYALKVDGTLWSAGRGSAGQLGNGLGSDSYYFVRPQSGVTQLLSEVSAVSVGGNHTLALKTDGTLWATGYNAHGELGAGSADTWYWFGQVLSGVSAMAAGSDHSLALKTDGTLWASGSNRSGQLGTGDTVDRAGFVQVMNGVSSVAAGDGYTLVVKTDGTLWATGSNRYGQLGTGDTTDRHAFVQVAGGVRLP